MNAEYLAFAGDGRAFACVSYLVSAFASRLMRLLR